MLEGYVPETETVLQDVDDEARAWALAVQRIVKNLRVYNDCHTMIKLVSTVSGRKIIMRDRKRFHYFKNGACSCRDYW